MATVQDFRNRVQVAAAVAIHSHFDTGGGKRVFREAISGYTDEPLGPNRRVRQVLTAGGEIFRVNPKRIVDSIRQGEKMFQLRVWLIEENESSDVNVISTTVGVEIEVFRKLYFPDEEFLYTSDEMLDNMQSLLDRDLWKASVTQLDSFLEGPVIDSVPERENDIVKYLVAFTATVLT